ncbi:MAG: HDOD domain-containing protein [Myxococcales bacterium]|nr:HDOD domain-containing protein [Myxococcales bacterium]
MSSTIALPQIPKQPVEIVEMADLDLPPLPQIAMQLLDLVQQPLADPKRVVQLVHGDQSLASRVLRIANSASYRGVTEIVSLQQAVARLGANLLGELAAAATMQQAFQAPRYQLALRQRWQRSFATALFAKEIARSSRANVEMAFLCGLMHNAGESAVLHILSKSKRNFSREQVEDQVERQAPKMADRLADAWKLPSRVREAMCHHEEPSEAPSFAHEAATVHLAALVCRVTLEGEEASPHEDEAVALLNLYPDEVDAVLAKAEDIRAAVSRVGG